MKTLEHIEMLLRAGKKPKELIEWGFAKQAVSRVKKHLKDEVTQSIEDVPGHKQDIEIQADSDELITTLVDEISTIRQKLAELEAQVASIMPAEEIQALFRSTPVHNLKNQYECECGSKGLVAFRFKCTACDKESWWGWIPEKK